MLLLFIAFPKALCANAALKRLLIQMSAYKMLDKFIFELNTELTVGAFVRKVHVHVDNLDI